MGNGAKNCHFESFSNVTHHVLIFSADIDEEDEEAALEDVSLEGVTSTASSCGHTSSSEGGGGATSSDHYILDKVAEKSKKQQKKVEHYRLKRMRDSNDNFIRLTKPLVVRTNS